MTKVSIIVPVYNPKEIFLEECIKSLVSQTLEDVEIILIDNGAIYNNPQILKEYDEKYSNVKLIKFENNVGFAKACNSALNIASGEYIQIVDSDDVLRKDACELLYNKAEKYNADLIIFAARIYNNKAKQHEYTPMYSLESFPLKMQRKTFNSEDCISYTFKSTFQDWNKFVKRELIFNNNNYFDEDLPYVLPDCVYSIKNFINAQRIMCETEYLYDYRTNIDSSVVKGYSKPDCNYIDAPIIFSKKLDEILLNMKNPEPYALEVVKVSLIHLFGYYGMVHKSNKRYLYDLIRKYILNLPKEIYTKERLKEAGYYNMVKKIKNSSYIMFNLLNILYYKTNKNGVEKINIFGLNMYRKKYANFKIYKRYLGFFTIVQEDLNARMHYMIRKTSNDIIEYFEGTK